MTTTFKIQALNYLKNKARADYSAASASLDLLLNHPVGIGDHSTGDFYKNLDEALALLVDAEDRLSMIEFVEEKI